MTARCLAIWGTASDSGKSTIVAALARILVREGHRVAPFKAQNMARHAYVCADGGEIGVAQAVQAQAARVPPVVDFNPILLKPEPGMISQVIVHGRSIGRHRFGAYHARGDELRRAVDESLARVRAAYDVVLIEGAGSPAEINLHAHDLANLHAARVADADVILVADIDRGGAFASILGTIALVPDDLRPRIRGVVVNKLYGDASLLDPGLREIAARTGVPVLGVVPHLGELGIADEDSVAIARFRGAKRASLDEVEVAVVDTPSLANFEDALPFASDEGVRLRLTSQPREILEADLVVLAGSKHTASDLAFVRRTGIADALLRRAASSRPILGICGGTQMLGRAIHDPESVEGDEAVVPGLALLPLETTFEPEKRTVRRSGALAFDQDALVDGFHLHHGRIHVDPRTDPVVRFEDGTTDGAFASSVAGTMVHRVADHRSARAAIFRRFGLRVPAADAERPDHDPFDRLADAVARSVDLAAIRTSLFGERP